MRPRRVWRMHRARRWPARFVLHDPGGDDGRQEDHNDRRTGGEWHAPPAPVSVHRARRIPMRFLHLGPDHVRSRHDRRGESRLAKRGHGGFGAPLYASEPVARRNSRANERESVSLRLLSQHRGRRRGSSREELNMHPFALSRADDPAKAIAAHAFDPQLAFVAGGTDLIGLMKDRAALPERLLDINGLPNIARIDALPEGGLRIGALARMSDVAADTEVRRRFPVVAEALLFAGSGQLRNMASIGGNIMQRTRCAYFRDEIGCRCNKRNRGSGCAALHGLNRNHAIFGWSGSCVATAPSDLAVALAAMDAIVIVQGKTGERLIPFADFHRLPGSTPERDNVVDRGDLIVAIEVPANVEASASHYLKVRDRASYEFALVSTAAAVATDGRQIRSARLAMGGVAHKPWRLKAAETGLRGISLDDIDGLSSAIATSVTDARPLAQNAFKVELAQRVALRALQTAGARI